MLKNFWYAVAWDNEVTGQPRKVTVLGQDLALFRTPDGRAHCVSDLCVHRGGSLGKGWMKDGCIVCPYHGWEFKPDGECNRIPASPGGGPIPKKARVDAYPTVERYGWVWVFLGDLPEEERPPIPEFPELENPAWRVVRGEYNWNANYERVVENGVDVAHTAFVHTFGNPDKPEVLNQEITLEDWACHMDVELEPTPSKGLWKKLYKDKPKVRVRSSWWMPSLIRIHIQNPLGEIIIYDTNIPVDATHTRTLWLAARNFFTGKWADRDTIRRTKAIFDQDAIVVQEQRPELLPWDMDAELHHKSDRPAVEYRKLRRKLLDQGWGIDAHRLKTNQPRGEMTVIPSPARRENPDLAHAWTTKEIESAIARDADA
jgi:phenylpropionate dioxygenase-like ring-hydroxylating dioxygenase large terminal subunit